MAIAVLTAETSRFLRAHHVMGKVKFWPHKAALFLLKGTELHSL